MSWPAWRWGWRLPREILLKRRVVAEFPKRSPHRTHPAPQSDTAIHTLFSRLLIGQVIIVPALSFPKAFGCLLGQGPGSFIDRKRLSNRKIKGMHRSSHYIQERVRELQWVVSITSFNAEMSAPNRSRSSVMEYCPVEIATNKQVDPSCNACKSRNRLSR